MHISILHIIHYWNHISCILNYCYQCFQREVKSLKKLWEAEKAKSRKAFTSERSNRLKTGGGSLETSHEVQNPEVEEMIGRPHIVEWQNNFDSDGIAFANSNSSK